MLRRLTIAFVVLLVPVAARVAPEEPAAPEEPSQYFETKVRPLLETHCVSCHGGDKTRGELKLTSKESLLKGGNRGPALTDEDPAQSLLLKVLAHEGDLPKMPPKGKLSPAQIDTLTRWVKMGAPWPRGTTLAKRKGPPAVDGQARSFWSFRPVARPKVPQVKNAGWVRNPVDAFVLAKLEAAGLEPAEPLSKTSLLRRVTYDLTGLPPTQEEVDAFLKDDSADAYEMVVDRLLASPRFGERWARHWLDLVRFAETNGYEFDAAKPNAWRYRDYVIKSLNDDKPYDQFVREQIAGDELD